MSPTILQRAVVDGEFRQVLRDDPSAFGTPVGTLPAPVEALDEQLEAFWAEGATAMEMRCMYTCSWRYTCVCDGYSK